MTDYTRCLSMRRIMLVAGASAAAISVVIATPAAAQCLPDPSGPGGTTTCNGLDADGLIVTSSGGVVVASGATVLNGAGTAGAIALSSPPSESTIVALTNNGMISATNGVALVAQDQPGRVGFSTITNAAGATIAGTNGAMNVWFSRLTNAGTIDGGTGSAIALPGTETVITPDAIFNSGSILSNSSTATIALTALPPQQFGNSGTIANAGAGLVIDAGSQSLNFVNDQGGVVSSAGPVALISTFQVSLINAGTINGGIVGGSGFDDRIDTRSGVINGSVTLNDGNDLLVARLGANTLVENVTGPIDGGSGTDVLELIAGRDRVLTSAALPTGFEVLQLDIANDATLTLAAQAPAGGYSVRGTGTLVVGADLTTAGPAIGPSYIRQNVGFEALRFVNDRAIMATLTQDFDVAVRLESVASAINDGTITAIGGGGIAIQNASEQTITRNNGLIVATFTGASVNGVLQNSGSIQSLAGTAVSNDLGGGAVRSLTSMNTGSVSGVTVGYGLGSLVLVNSGLIDASNGVGVVMSSATLDNRASGIITGSQAAIRSVGFNGAYIANAGTINGVVDLGIFYNPLSASQDWFIDRGGVVNGNVHMAGGDDIFVTDLVRPSGGVVGTIDGGDGFDIYRYRTNLDAQAIITPRATFEGIGYEVANGAQLTLTSPTVVTVPISFVGVGSIDMTADLTVSGGPLIDVTGAILPSFSGLGENLPTNNLTIVSRGTLSYGGGFAPAFAMVQGTVESDFENAGTITTATTTLAALRQWDTVTNSGTIVLNGNTAVTDVNAVINTGGITTSSDASASYGILETQSVDNAGTISVRNFAIYNVGSVINSGLIASSDDAAIGGRGFGTFFSVPPIIDNRAGGTISGSEATGAIRVSGGMLTNAGTIVGSVDLGYTGGEPSYDEGIYVADGGTITGNLLFGSGQDTLVVTGTGTGVSGTIDGGLGSDTVALDMTTGSAVSFAGALNFERLDVRTGVWTLTGAQSYADGASIATGASLTASASAFGADVANSGTLTLAQTDEGTFANSLTGNGTLTKQGMGTLVLAGNSSAFAGTTAVQAGLLALDGALGGQIEVSSGARLTGTGQGTGTVSILAGGTLAGRGGQVLTLGGLNLVEGSTIEAALGAPSDTGLFRVNGNVVLDGSLNVLDAGDYGVGVYRLIDYTGTLTDNRLEVASQPQADTSSAVVQTSLANQVNIVVNRAGESGAVQFWDGTGTTADGMVGGGSGTWNAGSITNWTNAQGTANASWDSGFAVFQHNGGTVTVESSGVASQGMQFASDGYRVTGGPVALFGSATMRVGDGSEAGGGWNATIDSVLSGAGSLVKQDLGTLTLTAASTYTGGTTVDAGTLRITGSVSGDITNNASLVFDRSSDLAFTGAISGNGTLTKAGTATLTLGSQSGYTGRISVDAGRLVLAGALPAAVTVNRGGTLGGTGTLASLTVASGGTVVPGNSSGTITVAGAFVQAAGSTYAAETTAVGLSDRIAVGGSATIGTGAVLRISRDNGTYTPGTRYTLLTAAGGIAGTYTLEQTAAGGTEFRLVQSANGVAVDIARTGASLARIATTGNQAAVAGAFGELGITNAAYVTLTLEPNDASVRVGLDQLSGEIHATVRTAMMHSARTGLDVARSRLLGPEGGRGLWLQMTGQSGEDDGDGNAGPARRRGWGLFGGIEAPVGAAARIGIATGYTHTDLTSKRGLGSADVETWQAFAYAGGTLGPVTLRAGAGYAWARNAVERRVAFSGFSASASSNYKGNVLHGFAEAGIPLPALGGTVEPFAGIEAYRVKSNAFAESSSAVALAGRGRSETFTLGTLGLRGQTPVAQGLSARTRIGWQRTFGDRSPSAALRFAAAGPQFEVSGTPLSRNAALVGLDLTWQPSDRVVVTTGYSGNIGDAGSDNRFRATLSIGF
ncbi:autotransporter domain-containing protein [Sphingobium algorifonticola]|uniref:Autotransporter domain-containing protein n=1 Tax=Sphingobium algorifonticola TaxID=2008318 RepID=A0A437JDS4_9SPHN|nr:autotransporter domain-containing protein [Sphingobium algorifonticola]RVT43830.1 autotransporter domain-containing protein [Sphingobium algorifonticola]